MLLKMVLEEFDRSQLVYSYLDPGSISLFLAAVASAITTGIVFIRVKFYKYSSKVRNFIRRKQ